MVCGCTTKGFKESQFQLTLVCGCTTRGSKESQFQLTLVCGCTTKGSKESQFQLTLVCGCTTRGSKESQYQLSGEQLHRDARMSISLSDAPDTAAPLLSCVEVERPTARNTPPQLTHCEEWLENYMANRPTNNLSVDREPSLLAAVDSQVLLLIFIPHSSCTYAKLWKLQV